MLTKICITFFIFYLTWRTVCAKKKKNDNLSETESRRIKSHWREAGASSSYTTNTLNTEELINLISFDTNDNIYQTNYNPSLNHNGFPDYQNIDAGPSNTNHFANEGYNWNAQEQALDDEAFDYARKILFPDESQQRSEDIVNQFLNLDEYDSADPGEASSQPVHSPATNKYRKKVKPYTINRKDCKFVCESSSSNDLKAHRFVKVDSDDYCGQCYSKAKVKANIFKKRYDVCTKCIDCKRYFCENCFLETHGLNSLPEATTTERIPDEVLRTHKFIKVSRKPVNCHYCYHKYETAAERKKNKVETIYKCRECGDYMCKYCFKEVHKLDSLPSVYN